jgi:hypothetical protein
MFKKVVKNLVTARLAVLPKEMKISVGGSKNHYSKEELIAHVQKGDQLGQKIAKIHLDYLRSFKESLFYR